MEHLVEVDYGKTAEELLAEGTFVNEDFRFSGRSSKGAGVMTRKFKLAFYHDLPALPSQIQDDFSKEKGWGADHVEILSFFRKHPEVTKQFGMTVGLGIHAQCHLTEYHDMYPAVYLKGDSLCACKAVTFDNGELSDAFVYLMVSEAV